MGIPKGLRGILRFSATREKVVVHFGQIPFGQLPRRQSRRQLRHDQLRLGRARRRHVGSLSRKRNRTADGRRPPFLQSVERRGFRFMVGEVGANLRSRRCLEPDPPPNPRFASSRQSRRQQLPCRKLPLPTPRGNRPGMRKERERVAQNRSRFKIQTYIYLFLCTSYLIHVVSITSPSSLHSSFPKPADSLLLFLF